MDQARITFSSLLPHSLKIDSSDSICEQCPIKDRGWISAHNNLSLTVLTDRYFTFYVRDGEMHQEICRFQSWFKEYGVYSAQVSNSTDGVLKCSPVFEEFRYPTAEPSVAVVPSLLIFVFFAFFILHFISYSISSPIISKVWHYLSKLRRYTVGHDHRNAAFDNEEVTADSSPLVDVKTDKGPSTSIYKNSQHSNGCCRLLTYLQTGLVRNDGRLYSLDTFRGITVVLMVFINAGGGNYWFMEHAVWDHPTVGDLPHPWFNWIMGVTIAVSGSTERPKCSVLQRISRILSRFAKLFLLGLLVSSESFTTDLNKIPILGVLQDLALLYLVAALLELTLPRFDKATKKSDKYLKGENSWFQQLTVNDCLFYLTRAIAAIAPMVVYLSVMFGLDVPGCGKGYAGPGGLHLNGKYAKCTGGAAAYVDRMILGRNHLAFSLPYAFVYQTKENHDSYGLFCLLSQLTQVYLGIIAGEIVVRNKTKPKVVITTWSILAVILFLGAWVLCNDVTGYCLMPLNRRMWSVTFILVSSALGLVIMTVLYACIEVAKVWTGSPFYYPGTNSVAVYVGHKITKHVFPFSWGINNGTHSHYLFMHLWQTMLWVFISILMYRKKIFLRV